MWASGRVSTFLCWEMFLFSLTLVVFPSVLFFRSPFGPFLPFPFFYLFCPLPCFTYFFAFLSLPISMSTMFLFSVTFVTFLSFLFFRFPLFLSFLFLSSCFSLLCLRLFIKKNVLEMCSGTSPGTLCGLPLFSKTECSRNTFWDAT